MSAVHMVSERKARPAWLRASLVSGFVATFAMTATLAAAYGIANGLGNINGNTIERWFAGLTGNTLTDRVDERFFFGMILNLVVGLVWAVIYANWFEPRVSGPGWRRGVLFAMIPFVISILVVFPIADIGVLGTGIDAGPLPVLGNLALHVVFGLVLGSMYGMEREGNSHDRQANENSEQIAALGMVIGAVVGGIGGWLVSPSLDGLGQTEVCVFAGALSGGAIGLLVGSLVGLKVDEETS